MKNVLSILAAFLLIGGTAFAAPTTADHRDHFNRIYRGYGNSFIFVEQGIEFAIFPDGQFDFNVLDYGPRFGAYADFGGVSISFNSGYSYDAWVQYDDYGAVIQIENVPIFYDYYGRIIQAGNVRINYNGFGRVNQVGGLFVHYNRFNVFSHCTGFINPFNRAYIFRPWHTYYIAPPVNYCVVFNRPYRRYYAPVRHTFFRPYRDNFRPRTSVSYVNGRRGDVVRRSNSRNKTYRQVREGRRSDAALAQRNDRDRNTIRRDNRSDIRTRPSASSRNDRAERGRPTQATSRGDARGDSKPKVRPQSQMRYKPKSDRSDVRKRKTTVKRSSPKRNDQSKRVSSSSKRKTNNISQRSKQSRPKVTRDNRSSQRKSTVSRSSSSKKKSVGRRSGRQ